MAQHVMNVRKRYVLNCIGFEETAVRQTIISRNRSVWKCIDRGLFGIVAVS